MENKSKIYDKVLNEYVNKRYNELMEMCKEISSRVDWDKREEDYYNFYCIPDYNFSTLMVCMLKINDMVSLLNVMYENNERFLEALENIKEEEFEEKLISLLELLEAETQIDLFEQDDNKKDNALKIIKVWARWQK